MKISDIRATTVSAPLEAPLRPGWTPLVPNDRWADPNDEGCPEIPA
ncbi:MAG: hypothetical protein KIT09_12980 [Bryobacteraceae bacterium]|nr:hypothetical protein [Bryobacteraceae bacterium]